ncbi:hypothetical protein J4462_00130 [Candidatus Pacearchaeota archaeon]|nr:hypothetical protein [Candidatus Pacearchaeota archaeon]
MRFKKAVSPIVAYSLLIVITISLSAIVYPYLKLHLPTERPECPSNFILVIEETSCDFTNKNLSITVSNRGLFNVSAVYIRFAEADRKVRTQINKGNEFFPEPISPSSNSKTFYYSSLNEYILSSGDYVVEIQPAIFEKQALYPCPRAIVSQKVRCE